MRGEIDDDAVAAGEVVADFILNAHAYLEALKRRR